MELDSHPGTGFSPSMMSGSKELRTAPAPKISLQITIQMSKTSDFKFELLPLHSQLLRQSLLVSFPPLIDMLKFSGYPYQAEVNAKTVEGLRARQANESKRKSYPITLKGTRSSPPVNFKGEWAQMRHSTFKTKQKRA